MQLDRIRLDGAGPAGSQGEDYRPNRGKDL